MEASPVNFEAMRRYCTSLPGAMVDVKWGTQECHCVGTRMFAIFTIDGSRATALSFKSEPERFLELTDVPGIVPAPYLARGHWVQVRDPRALVPAQARSLLARSHALVLARLTRRDREAVLNASQ
jgi:predicted DNA-binding protein (MmcQ/YjbR family)